MTKDDILAKFKMTSDIIEADSDFCTYITEYLGALMPPLYIGFTSIKNINKGYNGSVTSKLYKEIWKNERQQNPQLFKTTVINRFKTRGEAHNNECDIHQALDVAGNNMFINAANAGRRFFANQKHTEETKRKISESGKARNYKHSEETRRRIGEGGRGKHGKAAGEIMSNETREKIRQFQLGRKLSDATKEKISKSAKGKPKVMTDARIAGYAVAAKKRLGKKHPPRSAETIEKCRQAQAAVMLDPAKLLKRHIGLALRDGYYIQLAYNPTGEMVNIPILGVLMPYMDVGTRKRPNLTAKWFSAALSKRGLSCQRRFVTRESDVTDIGFLTVAELADWLELRPQPN